MLVSGDIGHVSLLAKNRMLNTAEVRPPQPLSFMLADVMFTVAELKALEPIKIWQILIRCKK